MNIRINCRRSDGLLGPGSGEFLCRIGECKDMAEKVYLSDEIFTEGPDGLTLAATQCNSCGKLFFPKVEFCPHCPDADPGNNTSDYKRDVVYIYNNVHALNAF